MDGREGRVGFQYYRITMRKERGFMRRTSARSGVNQTVYAPTTNDTIVQFGSETPANTTAATIVFTNPLLTDTLLALDVRPANGTIYALGSSGRLFTVAIAPGGLLATVTQVGTGTFTLNGTDFGFDFNPQVDRIRVVSNTGQNFRLNPNDGTVVAPVDTALAFAAGDANTGQPVVVAAYTEQPH